MELEHPDPVRAGRRRRVLITGGGQLGHALQQEFATDEVVALSRADWDVANPPSDDLSQGGFESVLHAAAWTDVDGAEAIHRARRPNVAGTANVASLGTPARRVLLRLRVRRPEARAVRGIRRRQPALRVRAHEAPSGGSRVRTPGSSERRGSSGRRATTSCVRCPARGRTRRGCRGRRPARPPHVRRSPGSGGTGRVRRRRPATRRLAFAAGRLHVATSRKPSSPRRASTAACEESRPRSWRPAPRPAYAVLRSEAPGAPALPHWRDGLRACLAEMGR